MPVSLAVCMPCFITECFKTQKRMAITMRISATCIVPEHFQNWPQNYEVEHFRFAVDRFDYPFASTRLADRLLPARTSRSGRERNKSYYFHYSPFIVIPCEKLEIYHPHACSRKCSRFFNLVISCACKF